MDFARMEPLLFLAIRWQMESPRPTPLSFVVKKGLKICWRSSFDIPLPVSRMEIPTASPSSLSIRVVRMVRVPPSGMASMPLKAMLRMICFICSPST